MPYRDTLYPKKGYSVKLVIQDNLFAYYRALRQVEPRTINVLRAIRQGVPPTVTSKPVSRSRHS